jgi:hypothetical protein
MIMKKEIMVQGQLGEKVNETLSQKQNKQQKD